MQQNIESVGQRNQPVDLHAARSQRDLRIDRAGEQQSRGFLVANGDGGVGGARRFAEMRW